MPKLNLIRAISLISLALITPISPAQNLPDLGSPGLVIYDRNTEVSLGRAFTKALHTQFNLVKDPETLSYVRRIGHRIASHTHDGRNYRFYVIDDPAINAFAGPDGIIGIHSGLILAADSEDELASVIAHEIAHVTQEHLSRRFEQQSSLNITSFASLLAAILIGTQNPSAGIATIMGATGLSLQEQLRHSRIHEHEADHHGISLLHRSGYNPNAMADFFGKLAKQYQLSEFRPPEILMTHPVTETRLAQASNRAHQLGIPEDHHDKVNLFLIQQRLKHHAQQPNTEFIEASNPYSNVIQCYKQHISEKNASAACLKEALSQHPNNRLLKTAQIMHGQHNNSQKLPSIEALHAIYPQDQAILQLLAQAYQQAGQIEQAIERLERNPHNHTYQFEIYQKLSQLYAQTNKLAEAYFYEANAYLGMGDIERAKHLARLSNQQNPPISRHLEKASKQLLKALGIDENPT
ncbi:MAG: M48 family metalloprotease [Thiomicrospira sp.]|uniref:beta-barrel assembly-enhancing protease n=1 Tax=Thiomicrospira sp. TaxID=935 RepID=UPI0019DE7CBF|nr:M48 family metalloprotease [Thiomicrospira sp.]MBE0492919.1 M48 family metalloprotease [Thiomicrospira sp.]